MMLRRGGKDRMDDPMCSSVAPESLRLLEENVTSGDTSSDEDDIDEDPTVNTTYDPHFGSTVPFGTSDSPESQSVPNTRRRTFEEFSREFEEKQKLNSLNSEKKTINDFEFKGLSKRNSNIWVKELVAESFRRWGWVLVALLGLFCLLGFVLRNPSARQKDSVLEFSWKNAQDEFYKDFKQLSKHFPSQSTETKIHILSAINSTMSATQPRQPSAITILIPPTMARSSFPACFAKKIALLTNRLFSKVLMKSSSPVLTMDNNYFQRNGDNITDIHAQLASYFKDGGRTILIQNVDNIVREEILLIFHSLCDNFYAPEKRASLIFLVPVPEDVLNQFKWKNEFAAGLSFAVLDKAWKSTISDDSRPAMIARVAATVVLLNDGDSCS